MGEHLANIDSAIAALIAARRVEVVQIRNNATKADAREKLIAIQSTIESLMRVRVHEVGLADAAGSQTS